MDSFYIITNILKDKDYAVTDKICNYIEQKGKKWTLEKRMKRVISFRGQCRPTWNVDWYSEATER